ncbi:3-deoxy-manno-octulosonate cytidylyltransferase [Candidatus Poribacteria bacterium]|nr:3-deoxy-manno-octulosonate cytidylyltransferase [Candidatus Poribacteria bacterium]MYB63538.1 3-deoxy-manno-octulosonate cytidylyltransferase [Candidatus Poribacteria bacterium]
MKSIAIIPARYASTRFEGKPLADILGKPMVQHVYERASQSRLLNKVIVATDDQRIYNAVKSFGGNVEMTPDCPTGTDRVTIVAKKIECDIVVNIQGDEPLLEPQQIDLMLQPFIDRPDIQVTTLKERIDTIEDYRNRNIVKVVTNLQGDALYFSRGSIPSSPANTEPSINENTSVFKHIGLYAFRKEQLLAFTIWERTPYEISENLEQLRLLENGVPIHVVETNTPLISVDVPADLEKVKAILEKGGPHL